MRLLLDTHLLLWVLSASNKLPAAAKALLSADGNEVFVSAASIWEIAIKSSIGRLAVDARVAAAALDPSGFTSLGVTVEHATAIGRLPPLHRDPFDRMLIAQAAAEGLTLLSHDKALAAYGAPVQLI